MWGVPPEMLCREHLLGEHVEMHMFSGSARRGISLEGYKDGLVVLSRLEQRHDLLATELKARGYNHTSPFPPVAVSGGWISVKDNVRELARRCPECKIRIRVYLSRRRVENSPHTP